MIILSIAIKNSVQGMCCGMAHLAGKTTYNNSWQMILCEKWETTAKRSL